MYTHIITEKRKAVTVETPDGRRYVLAKKKGVMSACLEGSDTPVVAAKDHSFKAIQRMLEVELSKGEEQQSHAA
jgi:hypothetical protein